MFLPTQSDCLWSPLEHKHGACMYVDGELVASAHNEPNTNMCRVHGAVPHSLHAEVSVICNYYEKCGFQKECAK